MTPMQDAAEIIRFLVTDPGSDLPPGRSDDSAGHDDAPSVHETHISIVVLVGAHAYKLKRAIRLPYLDFSTPNLRLTTCRRELELNRRTAPDLYLAVRRITRRPDGSLELDGDGPLLDAVVQMRRFSDDDVLDNLAQQKKLTQSLMTQLARSIAQFHASAAISTQANGTECMATVLNVNEQSQNATAQALGSNRPIELNRLLRQHLNQHSDLLDARARAGKVRLCHGDLHLGNICLWKGHAVPFDCLEFSESMATTDVLYDLAFLLMDLWRFQEKKLANIVMNRYMDDTGDISGLPLLPYFIAQRAAIRAQVLATQAATADTATATRQRAVANQFLDIAFDVLRPRKTQLIAIGGLSGTGKSTLAAELASSIGPVPGARILSSDRIRKRIAGVSAETTLPASSYTREASDRVYHEQQEQACSILTRTHAVIADAVFLQPTERAAIEKCARQYGVPFTGIWLQAPADTLLSRVQARKNDPSDATTDVVRMQFTRDTGHIEWHILHSDNDPTAIAQHVESLITQ